MLRKTALYNHHRQHGAKMGAFAAYDMPLYYKEGVIKEHEWVRERAGLFDVSHMGQIVIEGPDAELVNFFERMTPSFFGHLAEGAAKYTVLTNEAGGMIDDLIVTRIWRDKFFAVLNAGRKDVDIAWLRQNLPSSLQLDYTEQQSLIALQGPMAEKILTALYKIHLGDLNYMHARYYELDGVSVLVSRLGYTGEDGFELSMASSAAGQIWERLLSQEDVKPAGLAARDSLRLEMGYPLYGHDIDETTSPAEANLSWILRDKTPQAVKRVRVGLKLLDKGVAREGAEIYNAQDQKIGVLTSGGFSPTLKQSISMGYVPPEFAQPGTKIFVTVRERHIPAEIVPMPFVPARTKMKKKQAA